MTESLAEAALAFCRDCLRWEDAEAIDDWGCIYVRRRQAKSWKALPHTKGDFFFAQQLDVVLDAIREWADTNGLRIELTSLGSTADRWIATFSHFSSDSADPLGRQARPTHCHALLAACVEAHGKRKRCAILQGRR
jgi:hypothetical protein